MFFLDTEEALDIAPAPLPAKAFERLELPRKLAGDNKTIAASFYNYGDRELARNITPTKGGDPVISGGKLQLDGASYLDVGVLSADKLKLAESPMIAAFEFSTTETTRRNVSGVQGSNLLLLFIHVNYRTSTQTDTANYVTFQIRDDINRQFLVGNSVAEPAFTSGKPNRVVIYMDKSNLDYAVFINGIEVGSTHREFGSGDFNMNGITSVYGLTIGGGNNRGTVNNRLTGSIGHVIFRQGTKNDAALLAKDPYYFYRSQIPALPLQSRNVPGGFSLPTSVTRPRRPGQKPTWPVEVDLNHDIGRRVKIALYPGILGGNNLGQEYIGDFDRGSAAPSPVGMRYVGASTITGKPVKELKLPATHAVRCYFSGDTTGNPIVLQYGSGGDVVAITFLNFSLRGDFKLDFNNGDVVLGSYGGGGKPLAGDYVDIIFEYSLTQRDIYFWKNGEYQGTASNTTDLTGAAGALSDFVFFSPNTSSICHLVYGLMIDGLISNKEGFVKDPYQFLIPKL